MGVKRYLMRLGAFLEALMHMELDKFNDNPRIIVSPARWCKAGKLGEQGGSPLRIINGSIDVSVASESSAMIQEVSITAFETIANWHAMIGG